MIWMLLYSPSQQAYHIEELAHNTHIPNNGYITLGSFYRYDSAFEYYKMLIKENNNYGN